MTLVKRRDNMFPSVWNDLFNDDFFGGHSLERAKFTMPAVNVKEGADKFTIEMAAPGMAKDDFNIEIDNNVLSISSEEKIESTNEAGDNYTQREFRYSSFRRSFTLPESANNEKISANYTNGVLCIEIMKKEEAKVKPKRLISIS